MHGAKLERVGGCVVNVDLGLQQQALRPLGGWQNVTGEDDEEEKERKEGPDAVGDAKIALAEAGALLAGDVGRDGGRDVGKTPAWSSLH